MKSQHLLWLRGTAAAALIIVMSACAAAGSAPARAGAAATAAPDDQTLKLRVQTSLMNTPGVRASDVTTEVAQAVVTLSGTLRSQAEVDAAIAAARKVVGLKDVRSNLRVQ
jgi:hyperosmotically inducible protein